MHADPIQDRRTINMDNLLHAWVAENLDAPLTGTPSPPLSPAVRKLQLGE